MIAPGERRTLWKLDPCPEWSLPGGARLRIAARIDLLPPGVIFASVALKRISRGGEQVRLCGADTRAFKTEGGARDQVAAWRRELEEQAATIVRAEWARAPSGEESRGGVPKRTAPPPKRWGRLRAEPLGEDEGERGSWGGPLG